MGEKHEGKNKKRRTKSESKQEGSGVKQGQNRRVDKKYRTKKEAVWNSIQLHDLSGNRTRVYAVRGRRLDRLTNRPESRRQDSNLRPLRPERSALPN